jgi:uncharacterized protein YmfQ (DUF2313 family)
MRLDLDQAAPDTEIQPVCGLDADDYAQVLSDLLPRGWAWPRDPDTVLMRTFAGLAVEFARLHRRDCDLLSEAYPGTAIETLSDWERICGLPDPCVQPPITSLQQRRAAVLFKLAARGGQSRAYFIAVAFSFGFIIHITEFFPFRAGRSRAGEPCNNVDWQFTWKITSAQYRVWSFLAGASTAGEPLRQWGNKMLECLLDPLKPAHTILQFAYVSSLWDAGASNWDYGQSVWDEDNAQSN